MEIDGIEALRTEFAQLRRENRRLRRVGLGGLIALAMLVGAGAAPSEDTRRLETRELVLLNAGGKPCARWFEEKGDVVLEMGKARNEQPPLQLRVDSSGAVSVSLAAGKGRAQVAVLGDGTATLVLNHGGELGGLKAMVTSAAEVSLGLQAPGGKPAIGLHAGSESAAGLRLYDGQARERLHVELADEHEPMIDCVDTKGRKMFAAP